MGKYWSKYMEIILKTVSFRLQKSCTHTKKCFVVKIPQLFLDRSVFPLRVPRTQLNRCCKEYKTWVQLRPIGTTVLCLQSLTRNLMAFFFSLHRCPSLHPWPPTPVSTSSLLSKLVCCPALLGTAEQWTSQSPPWKLSLLASLCPCPTDTSPNYNRVQHHTPR